MRCPRCKYLLAAALVVGLVLVIGTRANLRSHAGNIASEPHRLHAGLDPAARQAYEKAKAALAENDMYTAVEGLVDAIRIQPDFSEAWYKMGAAFTELAVRAVREGDEDRGLVLFRKGVNAKRKARELIRQKRWYVCLSPEEQNGVVSDLNEGLKDAHKMLSNEQALRAALKLRAESSRE